jgi:hypothetical protein
MSLPTFRLEVPFCTVSDCSRPSYLSRLWTFLKDYLASSVVSNVLLSLGAHGATTAKRRSLSAEGFCFNILKQQRACEVEIVCNMAVASLFSLNISRCETQVTQNFSFLTSLTEQAAQAQYGGFRLESRPGHRLS